MFKDLKVPLVALAYKKKLKESKAASAVRNKLAPRATTVKKARREQRQGSSMPPTGPLAFA